MSLSTSVIIFTITVFYYNAKSESADLSDDEDLKNQLRDFNISNLYKKFRSIGVTSDIIWDVTDSTLQAKGFDDIQILRFSKARKTREEQNSRLGRVS